MSVVLDAYAIIAALIGERAADEVRPLLASGVVSAPNVSEIVDVCVRVYGNPEGDVRERVGWLTSGGLEVAELTATSALLAGALRARHYRRRSCEISLGDCCALALAKRRELALATADPALAATARLESVKVVALPDSRGRRPR